MKIKAVMTQIPVEKSRKVALGKATAKTLTPIESSIGSRPNLIAVSLLSPAFKRAQQKPPCYAGLEQQRDEDNSLSQFEQIPEKMTLN